MSGYPPEMQESIRKVEATRARRIQEAYPAMSLEERKAILEDIRKFNPRCSFPTIVIGEKVIVGYKEDEIKGALGL